MNSELDCKWTPLRINKSKKHSVGWVSDSVTQHFLKAVGFRCTRQPLHALPYLLHPCSRKPAYIDFPFV
jgi:hypothetical protein